MSNIRPQNVEIRIAQSFLEQENLCVVGNRFAFRVRNGTKDGFCSFVADRLEDLFCSGSQGLRHPNQQTLSESDPWFSESKQLQKRGFLKVF